MFLHHPALRISLWISLAVAQSSDLALSIDTSTPYSIPITPYDPRSLEKYDNPWGISTVSTRFNSRDLLRIYVNNSTRNATSLFAGLRIAPLASRTANAWLWSANGASFKISKENPMLVLDDTNTYSNVSTIPFGINLGLKDVWNGSMAFNGYYDANRINSTSWITLKAMDDDGKEGNFLTNGSIEFMARVRSNGTEAREMVVQLQLSAYRATNISLPEPFSCRDISIEPVNVSSASTYTIGISNYLLDAPDRCEVRNSTGNGTEKVILGFPFFQAAYVYVEEDGTVHLAGANDYLLEPDLKPFDARATLEVPVKPKDYRPPSSGAGATLKTSKSLGISLFALVVVLVSLS